MSFQLTTKQDYILGLMLLYNSCMNPRKPRSNCVICGKETARPGYKYCSNSCQMENQHRIYMEKWREGKVSGLLRTGVVSGHVKRYLREKFDNQCCLCGWKEINRKTGKVPVVADHIDGNWRNNTEKNLRLVCPNCDSLGETYAALNKGNGRKNRAESLRYKEARSMHPRKNNNF